MVFLLNELSLHGQYESSSTFFQALSLVVRMKEVVERSGERFLCCDQLRLAQVTSETTFEAEISALTNSAQKLAIIRWFDRSNWFAARAHDPDDEFLWQHLDVTNHSMAEAAFRLQVGERSALFGFNPSRCDSSPITVSWETAKNFAKPVEVENYWTLDELILALHRWGLDAKEVPIQSWGQLIDWGREYCHNLIFPAYVLEGLDGVPFSSVVAEQAKRRLEVLNALKTETNDVGERTTEGHRLYQTHFVGERAWFTDESDTNKKKFNKDMTFSDPLRDGKEVFCPWHGKISTLYFRIHFSWPLQQTSDPIAIVYIGPKITKN